MVNCPRVLSIQSLMRSSLMAWVSLVLLVAWSHYQPAKSSEITGRLESHPISKITGSAYVMRDRVAMRLRFFVEDLYLFHESVEPDEQDRVYADTLAPALEEHKQFLIDRILILDSEGQKLRSRIIDMSPLNVPDEGWSVDQLMENTIDVDMEFVLPEPPEFLTFVQNVVDTNFVFPSELEILIRQEGHETVDAKILRPGEPYTSRFVWDRPALDAAASEAEFQQLIEQDREELLGITSYDQIYSFLYITRLEVRHEILIPLATLSTVVEIAHQDPSLLSVTEQEEARKVIAEYFGEGNPVMIDELPVAPVVDRIDFYGLNLRDFAQRSDPKEISMASGRVGVILRYPSKQEPRDVRLEWDKFNSSIRKVTTVVIAGDDVAKAEFSRFQETNVFAWTNPSEELEPRGVRPLITVQPIPSRWNRFAAAILVAALAGGIVLVLLKQMTLGYALSWLALPLALTCSNTWLDPAYRTEGAIRGEDQAALVRGLLANVYRAFDYSDEEAVYDALAQSAQGDLLTKLYLEVKQGLVVQEQGGAMAVVDRVQPVEIDSSITPEESLGLSAPPRPGYLARCRWNVSGTIEHWGHVHNRVNQYEALFVVSQVDGQWRFTNMELTETKALENRRSIRRF